MNSLTTSGKSPVLQLALLAVVALYLLLQYLGHFWSISFDVAQHYALVARIGDLLGAPQAIDPSLGEMNIYPAGSHVMAAVLGYFLHSPLLGMHLTSLLAVLIVWGAIFYMLLSLPRNQALPTAVLLGLLLLANGRFWNVELFGREIINDYFYAQLVAHAIGFTALALSLYMERRGAMRCLRHAFVLLAVYFLLNLHLLAAVQLFAFFCLNLALEVLLLWPQERRAALKRAAGNGLLMLGGALMLLKHPYYLAMRSIGQNNGDLHLKYFNSLSAIGMLSAVLLITSAALLWYWLRAGKQQNSLLIYKHIGGIGLAMAALCLLQLILLRVGEGSEYAVRKYMYGINTVLLLQCCLFGGLRLQKCLRPRGVHHQLRKQTADNWHSQFIPALGVLLAGISILPHTSYTRTAQMLAYEQKILQKRDFLATADKLRPNYVAELKDAHPLVNYMFSIGLLRAPRLVDGPSLVTPETLGRYPTLNNLLTSENSVFGQKTQCRIGGSAGGLVVLDGRCLLGAAYIEEKNVDFSDTHGVAPCQLDGFSLPEPIGRWTLANQAHISCPLPLLNGQPARQLVLNTEAFLNGVGKQEIRISVNGAAAQSFIYDSKTPTRNIVLSLLDVKTATLDLQLSLPDAKSPLELGLGQDGRKLGVSVRAMTFKP